MLTALLVSLAVTSPAAPVLEARFIGNSGFEVSDGASTLLVDFPYRSGAYGYMSFDATELGTRSEALCLFTHGHADHFDPEAIAGIGCSVLGPAEVLERVDRSVRLEVGPPWSFRDLELECLTTEHGDVGHCSWVVRWHGRSLVVAGDVEHLDGLLSRLEELDVMVIPAWLAAQAEQVRSRFPQAKIVLSHHKSGEGWSACAECVVPTQGTSLAW